MKETEKTRAELLVELEQLRLRVAKLEAEQTDHVQPKEPVQSSEGILPDII